MPDEPLPLTNKAAADRLRTLLHHLVEDEPPLGPLLVHTLTPTPEEHLLLSNTPPEEKAMTTPTPDREYPAAG